MTLWLMCTEFSPCPETHFKILSSSGEGGRVGWGKSMACGLDHSSSLICVADGVGVYDCGGLWSEEVCRDGGRLGRGR